MTSLAPILQGFFTEDLAQRRASTHTVAAYRNTFRRDEDIELALEAVTYGGAKALGLGSYGLAEGAPADLVVVDAETPAHAVVTRPPRDLVVKAGHLVARTAALSRPPSR